MVETFPPLPALSLVLSSLVLAISPAPDFLPSTTADSGVFYIVGDTSSVNQCIQNLNGNLAEMLYLCCFLVYLMLMKVVQEDWDFYLLKSAILEAKVFTKMILKEQLDFYEKVIWSNDMSAGVELKLLFVE